MIPCSTVPNSIYLLIYNHLWSSYYMPGTIQALDKNYSTSKTLSGRFLYYPHFTDKRTETERSQEQVSKQQSPSSTQADWPKSPRP